MMTVCRASREEEELKEEAFGVRKAETEVLCNPEFP